MIFKGTLNDMPIIDLMQLPYAGRKTGHLVISGPEGEARLSYENGSLVHATLGDDSGMHALVRVVAWNEGSFEFIPDQGPPEKTIQVDLHRAVVQALNLHDELKRQSEVVQPTHDSRTGDTEEALTAKLSQFLGSNDSVVHVSVLGPDGRVRASVNGPEGMPQGMEELRPTLHSLMQSHPRESLNRIFLEDSLGTSVLVRLPDAGCLILVAGKGVSLGTASMNAMRLAAAID